MSIDDKLRVLDALSKGDWRIGQLIIEWNIKAHGVGPLVLEKVESGCSKVKGCTTKERSFTLPKILEYTKDHCNLNTAPTIISMLNYFLRNAEDSTQEEKNMVDEVERMMLHPDRGDQVTGNKSCFTENAQQVNFTFPSGISAKELMANFPKILKKLKKTRNG